MTSRRQRSLESFICFIDVEKEHAQTKNGDYEGHSWCTGLGRQSKDRVVDRVLKRCGAGGRMHPAWSIKDGEHEPSPHVTLRRL